MLAEAEGDAKLRAKARKLRVSEEENSNLDENVVEWCQSSQSRGHAPHRALSGAGRQLRQRYPMVVWLSVRNDAVLVLPWSRKKKSFQGISKTQAALKWCLLVSMYPVLIASWAPSLGDLGYITKWWLGAVSSFVLFFSGNGLRLHLVIKKSGKNPKCDFRTGQRGDAVGKTVNLQEAGCGFDAWHPATFSVEIVHFNNEHLR